MNQLTWEYLFEALNVLIQTLQKMNVEGTLTSGDQRHLDALLGLYDVLPRLHAHPQFDKFIPYLGVSIFHWWPAEGYRLTLDTWEGRTQYRLILTFHDVVEAQTIVSINEVPDTLLALIRRAEQETDQG
jgi:hypothetical protein